MTVYRWSQTAANNDDIDSTINYQEGQSPGSLNNSGRAVMAAIAKWRDDQSGMLNSGGTDTAYTVTTNQVYTALTDGITVTMRMHATNGADPTFAPDGLTAKAITMDGTTAVPTGALVSGGVYKFTYDAGTDKWIVIGFDNNSYRQGGTDVAVADGGTGASTESEARTNLGLGTGDSPQFTAVNIGHATDTTISRTGAGDIAVDGNAIYRAGGTDVPVTDGGTGASTASEARTNLGVAFEYITSVTASGASNVDFSLPAGYETFMVKSGNLLTSTDTCIYIRVSQSAVFLSGAYDYAWNHVIVGANAATQGDDQMDSAIYVGYCDVPSTSSIELEVTHALSGSCSKNVRFYFGSVDAGLIIFSIGVGKFKANTNAIDGLRLIPSDGTISGKFDLYGLKAS